MIQTEALKLALEALQDYVDEYGPWSDDSGAQYALRVGKEALAQPEQEFVDYRAMYLKVRDELAELQQVGYFVQELKVSAAYRTLERLGYTFNGGEEWRPPLIIKKEFLNETSTTE